MENVTLVAKLMTPTLRSNRQPMRSASPASPNAIPLQKKLLCAGTAACIADLITFPLDTAKVRLQIQGEATGSGVRYHGMVGTLRTISRIEGPRALYNGLVPGLQRQMAFASIRIGLYDTVKQSYVNFFNASGNGSNIGLRILAGITTGGAAVLCAQPTDVVKVRFQAQSADGPKRYKGVFKAYRTIAVEEGVRGLWKGTSPNVARNAVVNACELVSYDLIKEALLRSKLLNDNIYCHFVSAFCAGFCTTVVASPVDVVKTRFMNSGAGTYTGVLDCAAIMFKKEGFRAFYKGFMPSFMRLGSWNICMFICYEQLKRLITKPVASYQHLPTIEIHGRAKQLTV